MGLCFPAGHVCEPYAGGRAAVPGAAGRFVSQTGGTGGPECWTERPGDPHQPGNTHTGWERALPVVCSCNPSQWNVSTFLPPYDITSSELVLVLKQEVLGFIQVVGSLLCVSDEGRGSAEQWLFGSEQPGLDFESPWQLRCPGGSPPDAVPAARVLSRPDPQPQKHGRNTDGSWDALSPAHCRIRAASTIQGRNFIDRGVVDTVCLIIITSWRAPASVMQRD